MESPLLGDESGGRSNNVRRQLFERRSDAITHGSPYQKAAALVDLVFFFLMSMELHLLISFVDFHFVRVYDCCRLGENSMKFGEGQL